MLSVFLFGCCGLMGKTFANIAAENNCKVVAGFDNKQSEKIHTFFDIEDIAVDFDVIVDFSSPLLLDSILKLSSKKNIPLVIGSTGHSQEQLGKIKKHSKNVAVLKSENLSYGITLLQKILDFATKNLYDFDIEILEKHHNKKIDSPSGTALMLANTVLKTRTNDSIIFGRDNTLKRRSKSDITVHSIRGGTVVGEHEVLFLGNDEIITISHSALSRNVFACGAIKAAKFIVNKEPNLYTMKDLIN